MKSYIGYGKTVITDNIFTKLARKLIIKRTILVGIIE